MLSATEQRGEFPVLLHAALAGGAAFNPWTLYQELMGGRYPLEAAAGEVTRPEALH